VTDVQTIVRGLIVLALFLLLEFLAFASTTRHAWSEEARPAPQFECRFDRKKFKFIAGKDMVVQGRRIWFSEFTDRYRVIWSGDDAIIADAVVKIDGRIRTANAALLRNGKQIATGQCSMDTQADGRGVPT